VNLKFFSYITFVCFPVYMVVIVLKLNVIQPFVKFLRGKRFYKYVIININNLPYRDFKRIGECLIRCSEIRSISERGQYMQSHIKILSQTYSIIDTAQGSFQLFSNLIITWKIMFSLIIQIAITENILYFGR